MKKAIQKKIKLLLQIVALLCAIINILAFCILTNNIFDMTSFSLNRAEICMTLAMVSGVFLILGIQYAERLLFVGSEVAIVTCIWLLLSVHKRRFLEELFSEGYVSNGIVNAIKLILLVNISFCVLQWVILVITTIRNKRITNNQGTACE